MNRKGRKWLRNLIVASIILAAIVAVALLAASCMSHLQ
jgi:hypothetical protein